MKLARPGLILAIILISAFFIDSLLVEPYRLTVTQNDFTLFDGRQNVSVVLISDIHIGSQRQGYLDSVVERINALHPDIVLIGGDTIDADVSELAWLGPLGRLNATYGVYAVLGNHDYGWWGCGVSPALGDAVEEKLLALNITVLRNDNRVLDVRGARFALIGLDDQWLCRNNYTEASAGVPDGMPKVVLAHNQLAVDPSEVKGRGLLLFGHTHCGQVRLPFITQLVMGPGFGPDLGGRERIDNDTEVYVTCGVTSGGMRFLTNPEISRIIME
jgi:predicted MPP superfamily phosphohydrolase